MRPIKSSNLKLDQSKFVLRTLIFSTIFEKLHNRNEFLASFVSDFLQFLQFYLAFFISIYTESKMTSSATKREELRKEIIPDMIINPSNGKRYLKGRFLGKVFNWAIFFSGFEKVEYILLTAAFFCLNPLCACRDSFPL